MAHFSDFFYYSTSSLQTESSTDPSPLQPSLRSLYAKNLLLKKTTKRYASLLGRDGLPKGDEEMPDIPNYKELSPEVAELMLENARNEALLPSYDLRAVEEEAPPSEPKTVKVAIIGAGAAGLMTAMCLEFLNRHQKSGNTGVIFEYDIFEAQNRIGGRIYTHDFKNERAEGLAHQYYDIGAMRIPHIAGMAPTINLCKYFNRVALRKKLPEPVPLKPYYMDDEANPGTPPPNYYVHKNIPGKDIAGDIKEFSSFFSEIMEKFKDFEAGFKALVDEHDMVSTRQYLWNALVAHTTTSSISEEEKKATQKSAYKKITKWETYFGGTGWFNQAFSETILEWYDFKYPTKKTISPSGWIRLDGGMECLTKAMTNPKVGGIPAEKVQLQKEVTEISYDHETAKMHVTVKDWGTNTSSGRLAYDGVFSSATLGCLQRINMPNLPDTQTELGTTQFNAIRTLQYDVSCKIAIQFSKAWWRTDAGVTAKGCVSGSDLPIRSVVYPSWTDDSNENDPTVLIVSYSWGQDAVRMGSLIHSDSTSDCFPETDSPLDSARLSIVLNNLAEMYSKTNPNITADHLLGLVISHHAYAWSSNPFTADAFAFFGPGQFKYAYPALKSPIEGTNGRMMVIGEAVSAHHAWISGALYSAVTGMDVWLDTMGLNAAARALRKSPLFGKNIESDEETDKNRILKSIVGLDDRVSHAVGQLALEEPTDERFQVRQQA